MRVALIACCAQKRDRPVPARELYCSDLFCKSVAYAEAQQLPWVVLSALHHVVQPADVTAPYDQRLSSSKAKRAGWTETTAAQLKALYPPDTTFVLLCGRDYADAARATGYRCEEPLAGMGIGHRKQWLAARIAT